MGLKLTQAFVDIAYFQTSAGVEITGESPTCTIYDEADNTAVGVVAEIGNGLYKCSFTPDNAGIWKLRWRLSAGGVNYGEVHFFQAGQGQEDDVVTDTNELQTDWKNGGRLDNLLDAVSTHSDADVWTTGGRELTTPNNYKADVTNLDTTVSSRAAESYLLATSGTADSGTNTTLVDNALTQGDDYWNDMLLVITGGTNDGQARRISDFDDASDTITVDTAFDAAIDGSSTYAIILDRQTVGGGGDATAANQTLILGDVGDASGATLGSIFGILGDPAATVVSQISTIDAFHDVPAQDTGDNVVISDVLGNKTDTTGGDSVVALLKKVDAKTTNLPADPADDSDIDGQLATIDGNVDTIVSDLIAVTGTADSGTNTTLVDNALTQGDDYWNDMLLIITGGTNVGQARRISDFDAGSDTVTVDTAFDAAIDNTSDYSIILDRQAVGGGGDATAANQTLILGDIGDASGAILNNIYGILGDPATSVSDAIAAVDAYVDKIDDGSVGLTAIKAEVEGIGGITPSTAANVSTAHTTTDGKIDVVDAFHDVPAQDTGDNVVVSDVVGNKTDTVGGDSLIALLKQIIVDTGTDIVADFDRHVTWIDCWGDADNLVEITGGSTDINLPDVIVPTLPTGATIWKVILLFKCAMIRDTSASDNAVNGAAAIRIKASGGAWGVDDIVAYDVADNSWAVDVSTSSDRGGDAFIGNMNNDNLSGEVDAAATYNLRFEDIQADGANLQLHDVAVGLRIYIY